LISKNITLNQRCPPWRAKEELDIVPAQARVIEYWQEKAVFNAEDGSQQVVAAARPVHPLGTSESSIS